jgi:formylmethanofuran dehydrogenase subunit A
LANAQNEMEMTTIIKNGTLINDGKRINADILISNGKITKIAHQINSDAAAQEIDASGLLILPGCIDDQVHFREPGLTHKGNIYSESRAAVAGWKINIKLPLKTQLQIFPFLWGLPMTIWKKCS